MLFFLGAVQPSLCSVLVCHQETREPVAHQCDRGDLCGKHPSSRHMVSRSTSLFYFSSLQDALIKLMGEVCDLMPESYKDQCDDFIAKYGTEIVEFLLSSAAPHTICTLLHLCLFEEQAVPGQSHPTVSLCYRHDFNLTLPTFCRQRRAVSPLGLRVLPHVGCPKPTRQRPQFYPARDLLFPPICVCPLPQRHPQGLTSNHLCTPL